MSMVNFKIVEDTQCIMCGRILWLGEVVHHNETHTEYMCSTCYDRMVELAAKLEPDTPYISHDEADALARKWASGEVAPEDFDPFLSWWQSEEAVDESIKLGYVSKKQRADEIKRRQGAGRFTKNPEPFVDKFPVKGYSRNRGFKDANRIDSPASTSPEGPAGDPELG